MTLAFFFSFLALDKDILTLSDLLESPELNLVILDQAKVLERMSKEIDLLTSTANEESEEETDEEIPFPESALVERELTAEEVEAKALYEQAAALLNKTRPDKPKIYNTLVLAAEKGNLEAKALVAWAKLFGTTLKQDILAAKRMFEELAEHGNPDGHMGMGIKKTN